MDDVDLIKGNARIQLFEDLKTDKSLVNIQIPSQQYEFLTMVTGVQADQKAPAVALDYPQGFDEAVAQDDQMTMRLEFFGRDRLPHRFHSSDYQRTDTELWIGIPHAIERRQRRQDFRVGVPSGTNMDCKVTDQKIRIRVIDLSLGGAFGAIVTTSKQGKPSIALKPGDVLRPVELVLPPPESPSSVTIEEVTILRQTTIKPAADKAYAVQFTRLSPEQKRQLQTTIYRLQRHFLRKRIRF